MIYGGLVIHQQYAISETNSGINNTAIVGRVIVNLFRDSLPWGGGGGGVQAKF